jgi:hypothetical protein
MSDSPEMNSCEMEEHDPPEKIHTKARAKRARGSGGHPQMDPKKKIIRKPERNEPSLGQTICHILNIGPRGPCTIPLKGTQDFFFSWNRATRVRRPRRVAVPGTWCARVSIIHVQVVRILYHNALSIVGITIKRTPYQYSTQQTPATATIYRTQVWRKSISDCTPMIIICSSG